MSLPIIALTDFFEGVVVQMSISFANKIGERRRSAAIFMGPIS